MTDAPEGRPLRLDPAARSRDPALPAFLSRPAGAPVYHGFPIIPETLTEGWAYGAITDFENPLGTMAGDGYVVAPDGRRAGLVWEVGHGVFATISAPDPDRWGVYAVWFDKPIRNVEDLTAAFRQVLPQLQNVFHQLPASAGSPGKGGGAHRLRWLWVALCLVLFLLLARQLWWFLASDACLDSGGRWEYAIHRCEH